MPIRSVNFWNRGSDLSESKPGSTASDTTQPTFSSVAFSSRSIARALSLATILTEFLADCAWRLLKEIDDTSSS